MFENNHRRSTEREKKTSSLKTMKNIWKSSRRAQRSVFNKDNCLQRVTTPVSSERDDKKITEKAVKRKKAMAVNSLKQDETARREMREKTRARDRRQKTKHDFVASAFVAASLCHSWPRCDKSAHFIIKIKIPDCFFFAFLSSSSMKNMYSCA